MGRSILWMPFIVLHISMVRIACQEYQLVPPNGPKQGQVTITVTSNHSRFEMIDNTTSVRVGGTSCQSSIWISDTTIMCQLSAGLRTDANFQITVAVSSAGNVLRVELESDETHFSYDNADIEAVTLNSSKFNASISNLPRSSGQILAIQGKNFGTYDSTIRARVGSTSCEMTLWNSDTSFFCKVAPSTQQQLPVFVTLDKGLASTCPSLLRNTSINETSTAGANNTNGICADPISFDLFELVQPVPGNGGSSGGWLLTIVGTGFGTVDSTVRIRLTPDSGDEALIKECERSQWNSESSLFCLMPRGEANNYAIAVTVSQIERISQSRVTFDAFSLVDYSPRYADNAGGIQLEITGTSFGYSAEKKRAVRVGDTACIQTNWYSDTSLSCMLPPGYGTDLFPTITVNYPSDPHILRDEGKTDLYFSYASPQISKIAYPNAPANGGTIITLTGSAFGAWDLSPQTFIGGTVCLKTEWLSSSSLIAKVPAITYERKFHGSSHDVQVLVGPLSDTAMEAFTYDAACKPAPCVVLAACRHGCDESNTQGDHRHSLNIHAEFKGVNVARIIGNLTLGGQRNITVGNTTVNSSVSIIEKPCYESPCDKLTESNAGVAVVFGDLFTCEFLTGSDYDMESFFDCVMPAGIGAGHTIQVTLRNASYLALIDGCTLDMKRNGGNCLLPANNTEFYNLTNVSDVFFDYSRPKILSLTPSLGSNMLGKTANVTITGSGFGRSAVAQWQSVCLNSNKTVCKQLFSSSVLVFNTSCTDADLLMGNANTGSEVQTTVKNKKLAYCRSAEAITLICSNAFSISSLCIRGCAQTWNPVCDPVCPEDKLICSMPVIGGIQRLTVVVGGVPSDPTENSTFVYVAPEVTFVLPPELEMGKSSLLTVIGTDFGTSTAVTYAGREPPLKYDPAYFAPHNDSSLAWWDVAQYLTCFSGVLPPPNESLVPSSRRICNLGVTLSNEIQFIASWDQDPTKQQLIVKSPQVLAGKDNVQAVDIFVQSIGIRSKVTPVYAQITFRRACKDLRRNLGDMISLWYLGAGDSVIMTDLTDGRQDFAAVSFQNQMFLLGGRSRTSIQRAEVYYSSFNGLTGWQLLTPPEYLSRWLPRVNLTAVVFKDELFVMGGRTTNGDTCFNDVWVYIQDKSRESYWQVPGGPVQYDLFGTGFQAYFIKITERAPWSPRSNIQALAFKNQLWVLGGITCGSELWQADLWKTSDMRNWELVNSNNLWFGRNNIFAVVHNSRMWVLASVQQQFYNTFSSEDGLSWTSPDDSCALTLVDIHGVVSKGPYIILFTLGCHNLASETEEEIQCSASVNNTKVRMQNRIYYSKDGVVWLLARNPYILDKNSKRPLSRALPWQTRNDDVPSGQEFRWGYSVAIHSGSIYLIGGKQRSPYRDPLTGLITFGDAIQEKFRMDIWVSDGLISIYETCMDESSSGLTTGLIADFQAGNVKCQGKYASSYNTIHDP